MTRRRPLVKSDGRVGLKGSAGCTWGLKGVKFSSSKIFSFLLVNLKNIIEFREENNNDKRAEST